MLKNQCSIQTGSVARMRGITLIELMIVVTVIAILASFAYPSYQNQVRKTRRTDGMSTLLQTAQALERCYTRFSRYTHASCTVSFPISSADGHYAVTAAAVTASSFTLAATPQGHQTSDAQCGTLRLRSDGVQGSLGADTDANSCW